MSDNLINIGFYVTYALIGLAVLGILVFSFANIAKRPGNAKSALIGIVGLVAVMGIAYAMSTGDDVLTIFKDENLDAVTSRRVGMGLRTFYVLAGLAVLTILYVEVTRLFKQK